MSACTYKNLNHTIRHVTSRHQLFQYFPWLSIRRVHKQFIEHWTAAMLISNEWKQINIVRKFQETPYLLHLKLIKSSSYKNVSIKSITLARLSSQSGIFSNCSCKVSIVQFIDALLPWKLTAATDKYISLLNSDNSRRNRYCETWNFSSALDECSQLSFKRR